eukprot:3470920-Prymnesium_polylepis.2
MPPRTRKRHGVGPSDQRNQRAAPHAGQTGPLNMKPRCPRKNSLRRAPRIKRARCAARAKTETPLPYGHNQQIAGWLSLGRSQRP